MRCRPRPRRSLLPGSEMIDAQEIVAGLGAPLAGLCADSRALSARDGFLAYPGAADDGRRHIPAALRAGAAAVLWEAEGFIWRDEWRAPNRAVAGLRDNAGVLADFVYRRPSAEIPVAAVTGTNGKTTIVHYAAQLLDFAGLPSGIIGTLGVWRADDLASSTSAAAVNTTPDAATLHKQLRAFIDGGVRAAVIEASSHGIEQGRLNGLRLAAAVFSNAGRDHLDYHGDLENYWASKAGLFALPSDSPYGAAILNADDPYCAKLAKKLSHKGTPPLTYGRSGGALRLTEARAVDGGFVITVDGILGRRVCRLNAPGAHNVSNFLAAALIAHVFGVDGALLAERAAALRLPPGRLQQLSRAPAVYVDYAHTPDAFSAVLSAMRPAAGAGRLLVVFGCGGGRDRGKRRLMGRLAACADLAFITDDNPRDEDAAAIRADIHSALPGAVNIGGRKDAIAAALKEARAADTVLVLGKGHEDGQEVGGVRLPFSDADVVRELLGVRGEKGEQA